VKSAEIFSQLSLLPLAGKKTATSGFLLRKPLDRSNAVMF